MSDIVKRTNEEVVRIVRKYRAYADMVQAMPERVPFEMERDALQEVAEVMEELAGRAGLVGARAQEPSA